MKSWKSWFTIIVINIIALYFVVSIENSKHFENYTPTGAGMGVIEIDMGCKDYIEVGVINDMLYDSIIIKVNRTCKWNYLTDSTYTLF